jgi:endonuclease/exonuclease/phosphatase family metal-dependent hydrolase
MGDQIKKLNVAFWNVENLFCPGSGRAPKTKKEYDAKVETLADIINSFFEKKGPDILGLAEVGTREALNDLSTKLNWQYRVIWEGCNSKDDNTGLALLARKETIAAISLRTRYPEEKASRPKFIVVECSFPNSKEKVVVAVNHWASRIYETSSQSREITAIELNSFMRILSCSRPPGQIPCQIVLGDFNSEPFEDYFNAAHLDSTRFHHKALCKAKTGPLYNTAWRLLPEPHSWKGPRPDGFQDSRPKSSHSGSSWVIFDQLLVTKDALLGNPLQLREESVQYYWKDKRLHHFTKDGGILPKKWKFDAKSSKPEGVSDHFPLVATFDLKGV